MLKEVTFKEAIELAFAGKTVYFFDKADEAPKIENLTLSFEELKCYTFLADEQLPEAAPEEKTDDAPQDPEEQKPKRKYTKHQGKSLEQENIKQAILKAWNGDRSVSEICARTGYSRYMVTKYIPETKEG